MRQALFSHVSLCAETAALHATKSAADTVEYGLEYNEQTPRGWRIPRCTSAQAMIGACTLPAIVQL